MDNYTISIIDNQIFFEIINEIKLFSNYKIKQYKNANLCIENSNNKNQIIVFTDNITDEIKKLDIPLILISKKKNENTNLSHQLRENLKKPFNIIDFEKKIIALISKAKFKKNSLINLNGYILDKNERKIKKNNLQLQLSEKEINFLILFSESKTPISKNFVLKNVWNYSVETETHTVETHIHRLRKKIFEKFGDSNFIKNNTKGYFI